MTTPRLEQLEMLERRAKIDLSDEFVDRYLPIMDQMTMHSLLSIDDVINVCAVLNTPLKHLMSHEGLDGTVLPGFSIAAALSNRGCTPALIEEIFREASDIQTRFEAAMKENRNENSIF